MHTVEAYALLSLVWKKDNTKGSCIVLYLRVGGKSILLPSYLPSDSALIISELFMDTDGAKLLNAVSALVGLKSQPLYSQLSMLTIYNCLCA